MGQIGDPVSTLILTPPLALGRIFAGMLSLQMGRHLFAASCNPAA